jgi:hypothetical protein
MARQALVVALLGACAIPHESGEAVVLAASPIARLHGHNDYLQPVPLRRALALGLGSVEADVFLVDGELLVGHERWQLRRGRTLRAMYLEPLRAFVAANGGRVRADGAPFVLLVDIKADGAAVYRALRAELAAYAPMLTRFAGDAIVPGAVTVLLSGDRPWELVAAEAERFVALDGRLRDLDRVPPPPPSLVPWISDAWSKVSDWNGADDWLPEEAARLQALVTQTPRAGSRTAVLGRARSRRGMGGAAGRRRRPRRHRSAGGGGGVRAA